MTLPADLLDHIAALIDSKEPANDFIYEYVFTDSTWFPLQRRNELRWMLKIAQRVEAKTIFEIGADKAGTLFHWCKLPGVERVICCENRGTPYAALFEQAFPHIQFLWLAESSYAPQTISRVKNWLNGTKIDMLFIDGDKGAFPKDFNAYKPFCRQGGVIFLHDLYDAEPGEDVLKILRTHQGQSLRIVDTTESVEAVLNISSTQESSWSHDSWLRHWRGASAGVGVVFL